MMLTFLEILCVLLLSACSVGTYKENRCKLNNNLEYLNTDPLLYLNLPENLNITTSFKSSNTDYTIPAIIKSRVQKIGKELNICPPLILDMDMLYESCLINLED